MHVGGGRNGSSLLALKTEADVVVGRGEEGLSWGPGYDLRLRMGGERRMPLTHVTGKTNKPLRSSSRYLEVSACTLLLCDYVLTF